MQKFILLIFFLSIPNLVAAQELSVNDSIKIQPEALKFNAKQLIIPAALITYGIVAIESDYLKLINNELRDELQENIDEKLTIDDFSQYAPAASVYILNNVGIKGKHNLKDRSVIFATSYIIMSSSVLALKDFTKIERPDGSSNNSFPSGHTATAFMGAEFLLQEYKDVNLWYGISGYIVATGTGFFRIYNRRHWLSDVAMGAGIGILSAKIAYWTFPYIKNRLFKSEKNIGATIVPFYNGKQTGIGMIMNFN